MSLYDSLRITEKVRPAEMIGYGFPTEVYDPTQFSAGFIHSTCLTFVPRHVRQTCPSISCHPLMSSALALFASVLR